MLCVGHLRLESPLFETSAKTLQLPDLAGEWREQVDAEVARIVSASRLPVSPEAIEQIHTTLLGIAVEPLTPLRVVEYELRKFTARSRRVLGSCDQKAIVSHPSHSEWLASLARLRLTACAANLAKALSRVGRHLPSLPIARPKDARAISGVQILGSETHNSGQQPVLVHLSGNQAVVYKPVSLHIDHCVATALKGLERRSRLEGMFATLAYAPVGQDYGFLSYAAPRAQLDSESAAGRFFFRFGALIALAYALNITDMHMENVLAVGEHPILIDLETAIYRFPDEIRPTDICTTGLLERGEAADNHHSGLQGGGNCTEWALDVQRLDSGMRVGYRRAAYRASNRATDVRGNLIDPMRYSRHVLNGFEIGYRAAEAQRRWLLEHIEASRSSARVRHIARFTTYYALHAFRLLQPGALPMETRKEELLGALSDPGPMSPSHHLQLAAPEANDLLRGDVPYFWSDLDSRDLANRHGVVMSGFFSSSPLEDLREHIERLSPRDRDAQANILREVFKPGRRRR